MGIVYTGEELIRSVRRAGVIGRTGSPGVQDWDILSTITEVIWTKFVPRVMQIRENFFVAKTRVPLQPSVTDYRLPSRAVLQKLRHIYLWNGQQRFAPVQAVLEGNYVVVSEEDAASGCSLEMHYFFRPSAITLEVNCRKIDSINGQVVTLDSSAPAEWGGSLTLDVHSPHSGAETKIWDAQATVAGDEVTFSPEIDGSTFGTRALEVGDYVCESGWAALPGLPQEMHPSIAAAAAYQWAISNGEDGLAKRLATDLDPEVRGLLGAADSRIETPQRLTLRGSALFPW